jgi:hypothetical protein
MAACVAEFNEPAVLDRLDESAEACPQADSPPSPIVATFAFKSRTNFVANVVRNLTTNARYFSATTLQ